MSDPAWLDRLAHDLRGPLGPIQTAAELLGMDALGADQQRELIEMIRRQSRVLARMIDELADWTSIERGRLLGPRETCDLDWLLETAAAALGQERAARIVLPQSQPQAVLLHAEPRRLVQAFATMLSVRLEQQPEAPLRMALALPGDGMVQIRFGDPIDMRGHEPPPLGAASSTPDGLGLSTVIAAAIVTAHQGTATWEGPAQARTLVCSLPLVRG